MREAADVPYARTRVRGFLKMMRAARRIRFKCDAVATLSSAIRYRFASVPRAISILGFAGCCVAVGPVHAQAPAPALTVHNGSTEQRFTAAELLARPDSAVVQVDEDAYHHTVPYRAVPLLALLGNQPDSQRFDTVEAQASDGFVSQIPLALIAQGADQRAVAWVAVEDPAHPWPALPRDQGSAGPFYLIWEHPERSGVTREQWPYKLVRLSLVASPDHRWPQLAVPASMSGNAAVKRGHDVFMVQCLVCHRINGGGAGEVGPDLGRPMSPTQYLTDNGLRSIIRNPKAVRTWPNQRMPGFSEAVISNADLDALVMYLHATAQSNDNSQKQ